jgi:4-amino-4-deoxy-L-arabinose transferase-like glycosyltransferase
MRDLQETSGPLEASIFVEALRGIPSAFLAIGLLVHALLWAVATYIAEPSPPPQMAVALALGREWMLGYEQMPPLSAWISAAIFHLTHSLFAVRLAAALCVAAAGWILFLFARRIMGDRHAAIAVLVMVGVFPVAFPGSALTGDLLQMPLAAGAIFFWRHAVGERNPNAWIALGVIAGVMVYAGPQAPALILVLVAVTLLSARGRAAVARLDAALCILVALLLFALIAGPRFLWLWQHGPVHFFAGAGAGIAQDEMLSSFRLAITVFTGHFGFALLLFLATAYAAKAKENAPVFVREPVALFSRRSVTALAIAPVLIALLFLYATGQQARVQLFSPLLMLSGIAAVLLGGERLTIRRQRLVGVIALIYLLAPVAMQIVFSFAPGWLGENRAANWPAGAAARTLTEIYHTRTGRPLEFLIGERVSAAQIAVLSADRPHIFIGADPARSPWIDDAEFKKKGGVVFWEIRGADSMPPAEYRTRLPAFVEEAPLRLPWARGGGDPVRLGWAIVPPQNKN